MFVEKCHCLEDRFLAERENIVHLNFIPASSDVYLNDGAGGSGINFEYASGIISLIR